MYAKKTKKAFTIIEIVLAVAILAMLMVALGAAFTAATQNYEYNEGMYKIVNTARQSLFRITTDLRSASLGQVALLGVDVDNRQCSLVRSDGTDITYHYNTSTAASYDASLEDNTLYMVVNSGAQAGNYILCRNVTDMTFDRVTKVVDGVTKVKNVQISMTLTDDGGTMTQTLNTAAVVRTNM